VDYDTYSSADLIGTTYISITSLLSQQDAHDPHRMLGLAGWYPIYDTLEGIRGEVYVTVKASIVTDENPFSEASASVRFFSASYLDPGTLAVECVFGFVEELVVESDPEHETVWADKFRTARASNEARLLVLYRLSAAVRRLVGKKALEMGANAVLGYHHEFDIEGDSGIVSRGYGTACVVNGLRPPSATSATAIALGNESAPLMGLRTMSVFSEGGSSMLRVADETVYGMVPFPFLMDLRAHKFLVRPPGLVNREGAQLITLRSFPINVRLRLATVVAARSVKYLGRLAANRADQETRDQWWAELRDEVRAHAASMLCDYVVGYTESVVVYEDVCVLSATGTAAVLKEPKPVWKVARSHSGSEVDLAAPAPPLTSAATTTAAGGDAPDTPLAPPTPQPTPQPRMSVVLMDDDDAMLQQTTRAWSHKARKRELRRQKRRVLKAVLPCESLHVPFKQNAAPFGNMRLVPCGLCRVKWVPEFLLSTVEPPPLLPVTGSGTLVEARVCKSRGKADSRENDATLVSEQLIFLEIEMHRQLLLKLKVMGMNAAFSLKTQIQLGPDLLVGVLSATAVHTPALPPPAVLKIKRSIAVVDDEDQVLLDLQRRIEALATENRDRILLSAVAEADAVRAAVREAHTLHTQHMEQQSHELSWRLIGERVAEAAAAAARERMDDDAASSTASPVLASHNNDASTSTGAAGAASATAAGGQGKLLTLKGMSWFARRRPRGQSKDDADSASIKRLLPPLRDRQRKAEPSSSSSPPLLAQKASPPGSPPTAASFSLVFAAPTALRRRSRRKNRRRSSTTQSDADEAATGNADADDGNESSSSGSSDDAASKSSSSSSENCDEHEAEALLADLRGDKNAFVVEIDDEVDEDVLAALFDRQTPADVALCTAQTLPQDARRYQSRESIFFSAVRSMNLDRGRQTRLNVQIARLFHQSISLLAFKLARSAPCVVCGLQVQVTVPSDDAIVITLLGTAVRLWPGRSPLPLSARVDDLPGGGLPPSIFPTLLPDPNPPSPETASGTLLSRQSPGQALSKGGGNVVLRGLSRLGHNLQTSFAPLVRVISAASSMSERRDDETEHPPTVAQLLGIPLESGVKATPEFNPVLHNLRAPLIEYDVNWRPSVQITALEYVPGARVVRYLGRINIHLIKESNTVRESGGLGAFFLSFLHQAQAVAKAHVEALGGNALLSYRVVRRETGGLKNQTYSLISLTGDGVIITNL